MYYRPKVPPHPKAIPSMVMGIISVVLNLVTLMLMGASICAVLGIFTVAASITLGIIAVVFGLKEKKDIEEHPGTYSGQGQALAGIICGLIGSIIAALFLVLVILAILFFIFIFSLSPGI